MFVVAIVPALVLVVGALVYALSGSPKLAELGRLAFFAGLIALCFAFASHVVRVG